MVLVGQACALAGLVSTCRGALAPHHCEHGDTCDWDGGAGVVPTVSYPTPQQKSELRDLVEAQGHLPGGPYVPNRADRRAAKRRTPR